MATNKANLSAEQRRLVHVYYRELRDFFSVTGAKHDRSSSARAQKARSKLLKLYSSQFFELSTDVHDELQRRIDENQAQPDHLLPRDNFHVKRNQARQKLANLSESRFNDLVDDILYEIKRRNYHELPEPQTPLSPSRDHSNLIEDTDANSSSQSVLHIDPHPLNTHSEGSAAREEQELDLPTPKNLLSDVEKEAPSSIAPNTAIQQSQVIPKKASIEWSSDEEEQDLEAAHLQSQPDVTPTISVSKQTNEPLLFSEQQGPIQSSGNHTGVSEKSVLEDFTQRSQLLEDSDRSDLENETPFSPDLKAAIFGEKSKQISTTTTSSIHSSEQEELEGYSNKLSSLDETKGLSIADRAQESPQKASAGDDVFGQRLEFSEDPSDGTAGPVDQERGSTILKDDSEYTPKSGKSSKLSPLRSIWASNSTRDNENDLSRDIDTEGVESRSPSKLSRSLPYNDAESSRSNENGMDLKNQPRHIGSIKRVSLEHENSKREIEVLLLEGTKMDEKITELEKTNAQLLSARSSLENELHIHRDQNSALRKQVEEISKECEAATNEISRLKETQSQNTQQTSRSIDQTHQHEFMTLTRQFNTLSIENERLKQELAELELKLKTYTYNKQPEVVKQNEKSIESVGEQIVSKTIKLGHDLARHYFSQEGLIPLDLLSSFNSHIVTIFEHLNGERSDASFGHQLFEDLACVADTVQKLIEKVDAPDNKEHLAVLKAALSHAITSVRFFATYHDILPLVTVNSAISDISFAVCQIVDVVKITESTQRKDSGAEQAQQIPQTPSTKVWLGPQDHEFDTNLQDPRESFQIFSNDQGNVSPVKPLKITQKVVKNSPPTKSTHTSRKPSSTLFASIVNPSSAGENSPENLQFPRTRSGSSASRLESKNIPSTSKTNSQQMDVRPISQRDESETVYSPSTPSLVASIEERKLPSTEPKSVVVSEKAEDGLQLSTKAEPGAFGKLRASTTRRATDLNHDLSSGDESTDENDRHKNDDSNLTSDDDLTYQALKQTLQKKQKQENDVDGHKSADFNETSKSSALPRSDFEQTIHGNSELSKITPDVKQPANSEQPLDLTQTKQSEGRSKTDVEKEDISQQPLVSQSTNKLSFSSEVEDPVVKNTSRITTNENLDKAASKRDAESSSEKGEKKKLGQPSTNSVADVSSVNGSEESSTKKERGFDRELSQAPHTSQATDSMIKEDDFRKVSEKRIINASDTTQKPIIKLEDFSSPEKEHFEIKKEDDNGWMRSRSENEVSANVESTKIAEEASVGRESGDEGDFDIDAFDIENPDNTLSELLLYLEHRTIEVISTIQSLLTSIKQPQALKGELCSDSSAINQVIAQMVEATNVSMAQSRNAALKEHGNWVVQSLKDCKRRMTSLCHLKEDGTIKVDEIDDEYANKHFKQRLAGIAFDVAKCTKELVKTVEEASLKEEIEYLNSKLTR
ncbi:LAME_0C05204g1_1 [Lachancea meyersii CBS 8951]|uniref:LAME_0C05204g1_1 n=1 Tax=Lachancea meyersii CBS 8951 TaxID=1266667 RepID=A0A1G4J1L8_9SACH|nr:LAME_0C05204g1_1 [Lachancea meyersii CBS 8951]